MIKEQIERGLKTKSADYKLLPNPNSKATSEVWKHFGIVHKTIPPEDDDIALPFAACFKCYMVYSYDGPKTGTSTLSSHKCSNQTQSIQAYISNKPNNTQKKLVTKKAVNLCAFDMRPFEMFSGSGFQQFCHSVKQGFMLLITNKTLVFTNKYV
jgi:hypothetical protein